MTQVTQTPTPTECRVSKDTGVGNTKATPIRSRTWMMTWNNYTEEELEEFLNWTKKNCIDFAINEETGENGTEHLQIYIEFQNARTFSSLKKKWNKPHIEQCYKPDKAKKYCMKDDTKTGKTYTPDPTPSIKDPLEGLELRDWQRELLDILEQEPDNRTIIWIYDLYGNSGKTSLAKHLCIKYTDEVLYLSGGPANCKFAVTSFLHNKKGGKWYRNQRRLRIALFDYTRSQDDKVSYQALEEIKNGIFCNTKYECMQVLYDCPHVVIFANFEPEMSKLSEDRWKIIDISADLELA